MKTIAHYLDTKDNNFNLIRFIAASLVLFSHSYPITLGPGAPEPFASILGINAGDIAVNIFFVVSGLLVSKSFYDRRNMLTFLYARCLRIFPALIVAVLSCVFIIGILFTQLSFTEYLLHYKTYTYLIKDIALLFGSVQYSLPGVFSENIYPFAVNGSLWTLPVELRMYLLVALFGFCGLLHRKFLFNLCLLSSAFLYIYVNSILDISSETWRLTAFFAAGAFCYINRKQIPLNSYILLVLIILSMVLWQTTFFRICFYLLLIYGTFWFSFVPTGYIRRFNEIGDYSYGIYIYAFPIQQTVAALYIGIQPLEMFVASFSATLLCAYLSWHWIEKPALSFKR